MVVQEFGSWYSVVEHKSDPDEPIVSRLLWAKSGENSQVGEVIKKSA